MSINIQFLKKLALFALIASTILLTFSAYSESTVRLPNGDVYRCTNACEIYVKEDGSLGVRDSAGGHVWKLQKPADDAPGPE